MQRGTLVRLNEKCKSPHLRGDEGVVISRKKGSGFFEVYLFPVRKKSHFHDYDIVLFFSSEQLDVLEGPVELET